MGGPSLTPTTPWSRCWWRERVTREEVRRRAKRKTESSGSTMRGMTSSLHHCAVLERMRRIVDERTKNV